MQFVLGKGTSDKPRKQKSYRKEKLYKKVQVTNQATSISDWLMETTSKKDF